MDLATILSEDSTRCAVPVKSKKRVLELISELVVKQLPQLDAKSIFDSLLSREKLGSTGIGNGIAIPHGRLQGFNGSPVAVLISCEKPIAFDALDNKPVDLLFALLVPEENHEQHLKTLARIAAKLSDKSRLRQLRAAQNNVSLYQEFIKE
jgi:PTS system nitrogen regulatory IIA component